MHQRLTPFLEEQNCFCPPQFSFHLNYSTNNALMLITERIQQQVDNDNYTSGVFVDLKKVSDMVDHDILIKKLDHYGVRGNLKDWFTSYLKNRKKYVTLLRVRC